MVVVEGKGSPTIKIQGFQNFFSPSRSHACDAEGSALCMHSYACLHVGGGWNQAWSRNLEFVVPKGGGSSSQFPGGTATRFVKLGERLLIVCVYRLCVCVYTHTYIHTQIHAS